MTENDRPIMGRQPRYSAPKSRTTLSISVEGLAGLDELAAQWNLSRSELVELVGRKKFLLVPDSEAELLGKPAQLVSNTSGG